MLDSVFAKLGLSMQSGDSRRSFDFRNDSTILTYAATKFVISFTGLVLYGFVFKILMGWSANQPRSYLILAVMVLLTQYRDKFEKKIVSTFEPKQLHFARAMMTPGVYFVTTLVAFSDLKIFTFLLWTVYQVSYLTFYYDETLLLLKNKRPTEVQLSILLEPVLS